MNKSKNVLKRLLIFENAFLPLCSVDLLPSRINVDQVLVWGLPQVLVRALLSSVLLALLPALPCDLLRTPVRALP